MTLPAPIPLAYGAGGGGGGGLTRETDELVFVDGGNSDVAFLRAFTKNSLGVNIGFTDTLFDGTTPYATVGPVAPFAGTGGGGLTAESDEILMVDEGNSDEIFIRQYVKDTAGAISGVVNVELDGFTAYVPTGPITPFGGTGGLTGTGGELVLVDEGNSNLPFLRSYVRDATGAIASVANTELDGTTAYVPTGPVAPFGGNGLTAEADEMAFVDTGNSDEPFLRRFIKGLLGAITSIENVELDGTTPYVPTGPITPFGATGGLTGESDELVLVDQGNSDEPFLRRYLKDSTGVIASAADFELDGTTPYVLVGPIVPFSGTGGGGGGLTNEADELILLDEGADNEPFIRRYVKNNLGVIVSAANFQLDGTTPYVAVGAAVPSGIQPVGASNPRDIVTTYTRVTNSTLTVVAGALAVQYAVIADGVTVDGVAVPAGLAITHEFPGATIDQLDFDSTGGGTGDVLVMVERDA